MKLILCLDDHNGMQFNKRRQSRDIEVSKKILSLTEGTLLWMKPGSCKLFDGLAGDIHVDERCLEYAGSDEFCFVEDGDAISFLPKAGSLYVFRWNRVYPSDLQLPSAVLRDDFRLVKATEFPGRSHSVITLEVYDREG